MEFKIASCTIIDELGAARQFHYFLLVEPVELGCLFCENYGVLISEEEGEKAYVPRITTNAARIDELITMLVKYKVSPTALPDVVADWL